MISVLGLDSGKAFKRTLDIGQELPEGTIWIDLLHPTEEQRTPYITTKLADTVGPVLAVSDYMRAVPDQISQWVDQLRPR